MLIFCSIGICFFFASLLIIVLENNSFYFFDIPESLWNFIKPFCHEQWTQYVTHQIRQNVQRYRFTSFSGVGLFKWFAAIVWNHWSIYAHSVNVNDAFVKTTTKKLSWFIQKQIKNTTLNSDFGWFFSKNAQNHSAWIFFPSENWRKNEQQNIERIFLSWNR